MRFPAPGNSPGTLSTGNLALASAALLTFELHAPHLGDSALSDRIDVTGDLTLDGVLNDTAQAGFGTLPSLGGSLFYSVDTSQTGLVDLVVSIPEPSTFLTVGLVALFGFAGFFWRLK